MNDSILLTINGQVATPRGFTFADLATIDAAYQLVDVSRVDPKRRGDAVRLAGLLDLVRPAADAGYLTLHAARDDFHASIPLAAVRDKALIIYRLDGAPLPESSGGPFRFFIPDFAACHTHEIDECANVKFVDRIELSRARGLDTRPADERSHAALHEKEA